MFPKSVCHRVWRRKRSGIWVNMAFDALHSATTIDHEVIKRWAEERGGRPASVESTGDASDPNVLRIEFGEVSALDEVDWDAFFRTFDARKLAFLYQDRTSDGDLSRFNQFIHR